MVKHSPWEHGKRAILNLDIHKRPFTMLIPGGEEHYKTFLGSIVSVITILIMLFYGTFNFLKLVNREDYNVVKTL